MNTRSSSAALVLAVSTVIAAGSAGRIVVAIGPDQRPGAPGQPAHFRVDMHIVENGETLVMRRYVDGPRARMEMEFDGEKFVTIEMGDAAGTTYTLMPSEKRAVKSSLPKDQMPAASAATSGPPAGDQADVVPEFVGTETIDGKTVEKYRLPMPDGTGFVWVDPATQAPVRMEAAGATVEMKNYDFSKPSPDLFVVPKGYDVMDMNQVMSSMSVARAVAGGMAGSYGGRMGGNLGGNLGASIGGAVGGPIGSMIGRFLGQKFGQKVGQGAASAVVK